MENIVISNLDKKDIKETAKLIGDLAEEILLKRPDIFVFEKENWEQNLEERINSKDFVVIVAKNNDEIVGACVSEIKRAGDGENTKIRDILFIDYIIVKDEYKRQGIGRKMLDYMKNFTKSNNISSLELAVWGYNKGAVEFYEHNDMKIKRTIYEYKVEEE